MRIPSKAAISTDQQPNALLHRSAPAEGSSEPKAKVHKVFVDSAAVAARTAQVAPAAGAAVPAAAIAIGALVAAPILLIPWGKSAQNKQVTLKGDDWTAVLTFPGGPDPGDLEVHDEIKGKIYNLPIGERDGRLVLNLSRLKRNLPSDSFKQLVETIRSVEIPTASANPEGGKRQGISPFITEPERAEYEALSEDQKAEVDALILAGMTPSSALGFIQGLNSGQLKTRGQNLDKIKKRSHRILFQ